MLYNPLHDFHTIISLKKYTNSKRMIYQAFGQKIKSYLKGDCSLVDNSNTSHTQLLQWLHTISERDLWRLRGNYHIVA